MSAKWKFYDGWLKLRRLTKLVYSPPTDNTDEDATDNTNKSAAGTDGVSTHTGRQGVLGTERRLLLYSSSNMIRRVAGGNSTKDVTIPLLVLLLI